MSSQDKELQVRALYRALLDAWNQRDGGAFAALFMDDGDVVGFDGSTHSGRSGIELDLKAIFGRHLTARYVALVRTVRFLAPDVAVLRGVAGMIPPEQHDIHPAVNSVQTMVAREEPGQWRIALFQNTPAAYHGRPDLSQALTDELRQAVPRDSGENPST